MPAPEVHSPKSLWWLESLLWSAAIFIGVGVAAYVNETAREIVMQGLAYFFTFFTTPFVLETSTAFVGVCIVMFINARRLDREGDGWVEMEITDPVVPKDLSPGHAPSDKASEI
ncbi:hypothetical protein [Prosthecobacter sp.]|uniref:hypothetical protein n=1 Tax=Prosthecobacter sp. TaxID=1965333 RepID=UPI002488DAB1|nr:hypothetical protein [Prosthecobacter sp.]MDI1313961.1 hypothetical protein [Prosthecobacter sp.]